MTSYLLPTPFLAQMMRQESARFLVHTYTRTSLVTIQDTGTGDPTTDPGIDDWGQPVRTPGVEVTNIPCFFQHDRSAVVTPQGLVQLDQPTLTILPDDPLQPGDVVANIYTLADDVNRIPAMLIVAGPLEVESLMLQDPYYGATLFNQAVLRQLEIVPA